jgi:pyruvate/2-oxoglutarate dehydrogenase complex dihydrolipoamide acyltransferase (E2) component
MMENDGVVEIVIERPSPRAGTATVVEIHHPSGSVVKKDDEIFAVETGKATEEVRAPADGTLVHDLKLGQVVPFSVAIARIVNEEGAGSPPRVPAEVEDKIQLRPASGSSALVGGPIEAISARKREEIFVLSRGAGASMLSVAGVRLGAAGLRRQDTELFATKIVDLVIHHASRLMAKFRKLNAAWHEEGIEYHSKVNAGMAYDDGGRLVVFGIENSDKLSLEDIQDEIVDGLKKYIRNRFTSRELTRATFTVTDLSPTEVNFMLPLLPHGQSSIIAVAGSAQQGYELFLGFDHRVAEGRDAANFLSALRASLAETITSQQMVCRRCDICGAEAQAGDTRTFLARLIDRTGTEILCCRACWMRA